jgi:transcriptional regulator with XRE-family HTH domain
MQNGRGNERAFEICREYRESGLSQKDFCERRGVSRSTLSTWLKKERQQSEKQALVQVAPEAALRRAGCLRIRINDGVVIELERPVDSGELKQVLSAVSEL